MLNQTFTETNVLPSGIDTIFFYFKATTPPPKLRANKKQNNYNGCGTAPGYLVRLNMTAVSVSCFEQVGTLVWDTL